MEQVLDAYYIHFFLLKLLLFYHSSNLMIKIIFLNILLIQLHRNIDLSLKENERVFWKICSSNINLSTKLILMRFKNLNFKVDVSYNLFVQFWYYPGRDTIKVLNQSHIKILYASSPKIYSLKTII